LDANSDKRFHLHANVDLHSHRDSILHSSSNKYRDVFTNADVYPKQYGLTYSASIASSRFPDGALVDLGVRHIACDLENLSHCQREADDQ
jgi:hypothetical protein